MNNHLQDDLERSFSRDLKLSDPSHKPDEQDWQMLSNRLDMHQKQPRLSWWILLPFLLLPFGWGIWEMNQMKQEIAHLKHVIHHTAATVVQPTNLHTTTVRYDTIYKTVWITQKITTPLVVGTNTSIVSESAKGSNSALFFAETPQNTPNNAIVADAQGLLTGDSKATTTPSVSALEQPVAMTTDTESGVMNETPKTPMDNSTTLDSLQKDTQTTALNLVEGSESLTPTAGQKDTIQASADLPFIPIKRHKPALSWQIKGGINWTAAAHVENTHLSNPSGAFLSYELELHPHWAVVADISFHKLHFETGNTIEKSFWLKQPISPGPDFQFKYVEGSIRQIIPSLSLKYQRQLAPRLSWHLETGLGVRVSDPKEIKYEFENTVTNMEYEYQLEYPNQTNWFNIAAGTGFSYKIARKTSLYLGLNGVGDVGTTQKTFPYMNSRLGIIWQNR